MTMYTDEDMQLMLDENAKLRKVVSDLRERLRGLAKEHIKILDQRIDDLTGRPSQNGRGSETP